MAFTKVTALEFEALTLSQEKPVPIPVLEALGVPLNPLNFPANWSQSISIETRWQTDVTRPEGSNNTERWSLASRPARTLSASILGPGKKESHAIFQSIFKHMEHYGAPIPLYPDAVSVSSANGLVITGDFRYRRFFEEGRVVVMPLTHTTAKSSDDVFFAVIKEITPVSLTIDAAPRSITKLDVVIPCIDSELLASPKDSTALTDTVTQFQVSWSEIEGESALPATWPAVTVDNADVLSPFCEILDDKAIFPFAPNWASGIGVTPVRDIEASSSGRSSIQHGDGKPYHRIAIDLMGYNRERTWKILRFFDAMRGRSGAFYLIHPQEPWEPFGTFIPTVAQCNILPVGDADAIPHYFRQAVLTRADGTRVTREIETISDNGDHFALVFPVGDPLPGTDFISVQPIMVCNFDQDTIVETWSTSEVIPTIPLSMVELPEAGAVSASGQAQIQYGPVFPAFLGYEGLNLLMVAGSGCVGLEGDPAFAWPSNAAIQTWRDISNGPNRQSLPFQVDKFLTYSGGAPSPATLIRHPQPWQNNKQPSIMEPSFQLDYQLDVLLPDVQRRLWSPEGWTMFLCFTPHLNTSGTFSGDRGLVQVLRTPGFDHPVFRIWLHTNAHGNVVSLDYQDGGGLLRLDNVTLLDLGDVAQSFPLIITVRIDAAAGKLHMWHNGEPSTAAGGLTAPSGLWLQADYTSSDWFHGLAGGHTASSLRIHEGLWPEVGCANLLLSYDNPLSIDDINEIQTHIADMYSTNIAVSAIY